MSKNTLTSGLINYITYSSGSLSTSGSLTVTGSLNATNGITGSFQGVATTASYVLNAVSSSFATTASYAVSASITTNAVTSSHALNAVSSSFATTAVTSSFANAFTVAGTLTATTLVVQTITSSVDFVTGSTRFGSLLANTHAFTGSVGITGSLTLNNIAIPTSASLASTYLPLTGGTLTGALSGTSATFSSNNFDLTGASTALTIARTTGSGFVGNATAGAYVNFYGATHSTKANKLEIVAASGVDIQNVLTGTSATFSGDVGIVKSGPLYYLQNSTSITTGTRGDLAWYNSSVSTVALIRASAITDNVGTGLDFYTRPAGGSLTQVLTIASTGAATFSNSVSIGGYLTGTGVNPGGLGGSRYLIDFSGNYSRFFSYGINNATNGAFLFNSQRSDGTNSIDFLSIASTGDATFSNNVGISAAPNSWNSTFKVLQIGTAVLSTNSPAYGYLSANFYNDAAGTDRYITSGKAGVIAISNGEILFYNTNTSGTANAALTTTERMRITSGGNVGINQTSPSTQFQIRKNYWQFWNEKTHGSSVDLFSITLPDFGAAVVTIAGSRYSPGADNYQGTSIFYIYVTNIGAVSVTGGNTSGTFTPTTSVSSKTVTFASAYAGSATNYTGVSVEIIASGHSGGGESAITVAVL